MVAEPPRHIAAEWHRFAERVLPSTAGKVQRIETRRAFYAGAACILQRLLRYAGDDQTDETEGVAFLEEIDAEIDAYLVDQQEGRA